MFFGFITGGLARLAVPGPDPMPIWLTIAIGLAGAWSGGALAAAIWGWTSQAVPFLGFIVAVLLVIAYRRFVQKRPLTGPEALKFPERGFGIEKFKERRQQMEDMVRRQHHQTQNARYEEVTEQIRKLGELHDQGVLTDEEFQAKKA